MAIRNVVLEGDEILRKKCREISEVTDRIRETMEDMVDTMHEQMGCGLAGPQIGIMRRMFVAEPEIGKVYYMINPKMLEQEGEQNGSEGCLSLPGLVGNVVRPQRIRMQALDLNGEEHIYDFEGWTARVMCHEYDHLDGILYTDKATNVREAEELDEEEE